MWEVLYIQITCPSATLVVQNAPYWRKRKDKNRVSVYSDCDGQNSFAFGPQLSELDDGGRCRRFEPVRNAAWPGKR